MRKSILFSTAALTLAASLTAPVTAHGAVTNICPTYVNMSAIDNKLCNELYSQLRETLDNCQFKYGAVIVNGECIQLPSGGITKPEQPDITPPENNDSGNTENQPENTPGTNDSCNTGDKPDNSGSGNTENIPGNSGSGSTENKPGNDNTGGTENAPDNTGSGSTENTPADTELSFARQVVELVNQERAKAGVSPLTIDTGLESAALVRTREIQTSFSHTRPNGNSFATAIQEAGVTYRRSGENIAWGQRTPEAVVNAWMNSEGHRANILNKNFSRIGVGYLTNGSGTPYWVQLFAD